MRGLWNRHLEVMSDDYHRTAQGTHTVEQNVLIDVRNMLQSMRKDIKSFPIPGIDDALDMANGVPREIFEEPMISVDHELTTLSNSLNIEQRVAYDEILAVVDSGEGGRFFVDAPGGTGKTFLFKALLSTIYGQGKIAVMTAMSGVAASIMPKGIIAHSRFMIPTS